MSHHSITPIAPELLAEIEASLSDLQSNGSLLYESKGQTIHRFQVGDLDLVAKSYPLKTIQQKIAALFRHSRADRSFRTGLRFLNAGINTPRPILLSRTKDEHILVTEFCPHKELLKILVAGEELPPSVPSNILILLHQLAEIHFTHGDFHARNLLIDPEGTPHLIDLDGARGHAGPSRILRDRDRLLRSIKTDPKYFDAFEEVLGSPAADLPKK